MKLDIIKIDLTKFKNKDSVIAFNREHDLGMSKHQISQIYFISGDKYKFLFFDKINKIILGFIEIEDYKKGNFGKIVLNGDNSNTIIDYQKNPELVNENKVSTKVNKDEHTDKKHLELKLQECIESEDYLEAARIRDIIKELI